MYLNIKIKLKKNGKTKHGLSNCARAGAEMLASQLPVWLCQLLAVGDNFAELKRLSKK